MQTCTYSIGKIVDPCECIVATEVLTGAGAGLAKTVRGGSARCGCGQVAGVMWGAGRLRYRKDKEDFFA